jgi:hypothetical protein
VVTGPIAFTGDNGDLTISAPTLPTNTISGFTAGSGDTIVLGGLAVGSGTVVVKTANVVTISAGTQTFKLNISGATVGETDFHYTGNILTRGTVPALRMGFLRPPAAAAAAPAFADAPVLVRAASGQAAASVLSAPALPGLASHDLLRTGAKGGVALAPHLAGAPHFIA